MAKDPAFLFYPGDYLSGTMYLDFECKGAYIDLLMLQFNKDRMTIHMIKHMLGHKFDHIWSHISDKFIVENIGGGDFYYNERLRLEKGLRVNYCKSRRTNKNGGVDDEDITDHMNSDMSDHMEDEDINEDPVLKDLNVSFEEFWEMYDYKKGDKAKLSKKWAKLKNSERDAVMNHLPGYKEDTPDKQFRKYPGTYLGNKSWNDERSKNGTTIIKNLNGNSGTKLGTSAARIEVAKNW